MAKKNGIVKAAPAALASWEAELEKDAAEGAAQEQLPTGSFVSIRGGIMSIGGSPIKDNKVQVVILDHVYENAHYAGDYDPEAPQPPSCYAFGRNEEEMKPHEKASKPEADACLGCDKNVFGSAEKGKGKACKNTRRLALISADNLNAGSIRDGELVYLKLPVTSTKGWALYVKGLAALYKRPAYAVVTEVAVVPDAKTQFKVTFNRVDGIPAELGPAIKARRAKVAEEIMFPYGQPTELTKKDKKQDKPKARKF